MTMKKTLTSLLAAGALVAPVAAQSSLYTVNQSGGVQGTALNSTSVIGAGTAGATAVSIPSGSQTALSGTPSSMVDAGQYNNNITMYLNNAGTLQLINNANGGNAGGFQVNGASAVSSAVNVNGTLFAILAGSSMQYNSASAPVQILNLSDGSLTPMAGSWNLTDMTGLDAMMRPGSAGNSLNDLAIGLLYNQGGDPLLNIYSANGLQLDSIAPNSSYGLMRDLSFDSANNQIWYGTQKTAGSGRLFNEAYNFNIIAVPEPTTYALATLGGAALLSGALRRKK